MRGWPVAAGFAGVFRAAARLENSSPVFAVCCFTFWATGPSQELDHQLLWTAF